MVKVRRRTYGRPYRAAASGIYRYGRRILQGAASGLAANAARTFTQSTTKSKREMAPLTAEKDVRVVYVKRSMPRRKKRVYQRRIRQFRAMQMRDEPSRIHSLVWAENPNALLNCSRYFGAFMGLVGNNQYDTGLRNLWENLGTTDLKLKHARLRIDHMSLNVVIRNVSAAGNAGGILDLDVYKVIFTKDVPMDRWDSTLKVEDVMATMKAELRQHQGMDIEVTNAGTGIGTAQTNAGTTASNQAVGDILFNNPPFLRYIKILKCWKVQLGANQTATFNMRSSRNKTVTRAECMSEESGAIAAKAYFTQGYIFNINGRWATGGAPGFEPVAAICEHFVRYNFKPITPNSSDTLVYDGV